MRREQEGSIKKREGMREEGIYGKKGRCIRNSAAQRAATTGCSGQLTVQG